MLNYYTYCLGNNYIKKVIKKMFLNKNNILIDWDSVQDKTIILSFSGGLDSSTLYYSLLELKVTKNIIPVFFDYGQRHLKQELKSAKKIFNYIQNKFNLPNNGLQIIKLNLDYLRSSSLINKTLEVDEGQANTLPNSFVAGRNLLFLTYLASLGYNINNKDIIIGLANHYDDFNSYPDCRMDTLKSLQKTLSYGLDKKVKIFAPFTKLTKIDIVQYSNKYIIKNSYSCYEGGDVPCGICKSCILRNKAITDNPFRIKGE